MVATLQWEESDFTSWDLAEKSMAEGLGLKQIFPLWQCVGFILNANVEPHNVKQREVAGYLADKLEVCSLTVVHLTVHSGRYF